MEKPIKSRGKLRKQYEDETKKKLKNEGKQSKSKSTF